jgi:hypothetical protein
MPCKGHQQGPSETHPAWGQGQWKEGQERSVMGEQIWPSTLYVCVCGCVYENSMIKPARTVGGMREGGVKKE